MNAFESIIFQSTVLFLAGFVAGFMLSHFVVVPLSANTPATEAVVETTVESVPAETPAVMVEEEVKASLPQTPQDVVTEQPETVAPAAQ